MSWNPPPWMAAIASGLVGAPATVAIQGLGKLLGTQAEVVDAAEDPIAAAGEVASGAASGRAGVRASTPAAEAAPDYQGSVGAPLWPWALGLGAVVAVVVVLVTRRKR